MRKNPGIPSSFYDYFMLEETVYKLNEHVDIIEIDKANGAGARSLPLWVRWLLQAMLPISSFGGLYVFNWRDNEDQQITFNTYWRKEEGNSAIQ